jgi:hypothetical protein
MILASVWLGLALLLCAFAWFANRRMIALTLPVAVIIAAGALWVPTGSPRFTPIPKGDYAIVGVKIVVDEAIYLLLDSGGVPVYYVIPYSAGKANDLQDALDAGGGKGVRVKADGEEGGETFDGPPPVTADEPKIPEAPAFAQ